MKIYYKKKFWAGVGALLLGLALPGTCLFVGWERYDLKDAVLTVLMILGGISGILRSLDRETARQDRDADRDERDREVEADASLRAGNAVVLVSQLLSAACLLRDDPAWLALLSLTFIWGAVKGFHKFGRDREGVYLAGGLASGAVAAALLGVWFHRAWSAGMSLARLIGYAVACRALTMLAGLVSVGLLLGLMWLAHKLGHMDGERWETYFRSISTAGLLARMALVMAAALGLVAALSVPLFAHLGFGEPVKLAVLFFAAGGAHLLTKFSRRREELAAKLLRFKR